MLVLSRRKFEKLILTTESGERIELAICEITWGRVRLGIAAPDSVKILREELIPDHLKETHGRHS